MDMDEKEQKLDKLAWLSLTKPESIKLSELGLGASELEGICGIVGDQVTFLDPVEANDRAIRHLQSTVIDPLADKPVELFDALQRCWSAAGQARSANLPSVAFAQRHNRGQLDALQLAIEAAQGGTDGFKISRVMSALLPLLDAIDIPNLLILILRLGKHGFLQQAAGEWMGEHPAAIPAVVEGALAAPSTAFGPLLRVSLIRGVDADKAFWLARIHALVGDSNPLVSLPALEALGFLDWSHMAPVEIDRAIEVIREKLQAEGTDVRTTASRSALELVSTAPDRHALIDEIASLGEPYAASMIGDHLAFAADSLREQSWYLPKIDLLATVRQDDGAGHGIDHILAKLYRSPEKDRCLAWLDIWALTNAGRVPSLPDEFHELFGCLVQDLETLSALLARWLMNAPGYQRMARKILDELGLQRVSGLAYPVSVIDSMSLPQLTHLVRRTLANVIRDDQRVSLIWSLTRTTSAESRTFPLVREAMARNVAYDYPVATREHLDALVTGAGNDAVARLARQILDDMAVYYDALKALPTAEELRPSSEQSRRFEKERRRLMSEAFEESSKDALFRQIATSIPLKAGRSMFLMRNGEVGETTQMMSSSHSMAVPRSESIDKVGSDIQRLRFVSGKMENDET